MITEYKKITWKDLGIRERISYITAIAAFIIGFSLVIAGFIVEPTGVLHDSILYVTGECLIYCSAVFSISSYLTSSARMLKHRLNDRLDDLEKAQLERERLRYTDSIQDTP